MRFVFFREKLLFHNSWFCLRKTTISGAQEAIFSVFRLYFLVFCLDIDLVLHNENRQTTLYKTWFSDHQACFDMLKI